MTRGAAWWTASVDRFPDGSPRKCDVWQGPDRIGSATIRPGLDAIRNVELFAAAPQLLDALRVTASNIRSLGPAGALGRVPMPYTEWLALVDAAIAKAEGA